LPSCPELEFIVAAVVEIVEDPLTSTEVWPELDEVLELGILELCSK
jgi:hypothetical protein